MLNPLQLKVLSRFMAQVKEFRDIFEFVKKQLHLGDHGVSHDNPCRRGQRFNESRGSEDIFSSICMSILQPQSTTIKVKKPQHPSIIDSMIRLTPDLQKSVSCFNQQFRRQLKQKNILEKVSQQMSTELRVVNFEKHLEVKIELKTLLVTVLKEVECAKHPRKWISNPIYTNNIAEQITNKQVPCGNFVFYLENVSFLMKDKQHLIQLQVARAKLLNVKLSQNKSKVHQNNQPKATDQIKEDNLIQVTQQQQSTFYSMASEELQFVDVQSSVEFYCYQEMTQLQGQPQKQINSRNKQTQNNKLQAEQPVYYSLSKNEHYCIEQLLSLSQHATETTHSQNLHSYTFLPRHSSESATEKHLLYQPSLKLTINNKKRHQPIIKVDLLEVGLSLNLAAAKEIIQISHFTGVNPLLNPVETVQESTIPLILQQEHPKTQNPFSKKPSMYINPMLESRYHFGTSTDSVFIQDIPSPKPQPSIELTINELYLGYYSSSKKQSDQEQYDQTDQTSLQQSHHKCFCNLSRTGLYLQVFSLFMQLKPQQTLHLSLKKIVTGLIEVRASRIHKVKGFINIQSPTKLNKQQPLQLIIEKQHKQKINLIYLVVPQCSIKIDEITMLSTLKFLNQQLQEVSSFRDYFFELESTKLNDQTNFTNQHTRHTTHRKPPPPSYDTMLQLFISNTTINVIGIEVFVKSIFMKKLSDEVTIKIGQLIIALEQNIQLFLNEMKNNELCLRQFIQKERKWPFVKDSSVLLAINGNDNFNSKGKQAKQPQRFQPKNKKQFFAHLLTKKSSIQLTVTKTSPSLGQSSGMRTKQSLLTSKDKFKFSKKPSSRQSSSDSILSSQSVIIEEEQQKWIKIALNQQIHLMANTLFRLIERKQHIEQFVKKTLPLTNSINNQLNLLSPAKNLRKQSIDSEVQRTQSLHMSLSPGRLNIDIRPTFIQHTESLKRSNSHHQNNPKQQHNQPNHKKTKREIIFSTSRSYCELLWDAVEVQVDKRVGVIKGKGSLGMKVYFLQHQDREINTNPVIITQQQLQLLGFIPILEIHSLKLSLQSSPSPKLTLCLTLSSLTFESSLSTLCHLQLHFQHFINHNVKGNFGKTKKEDEETFQVLDLQTNSDKNSGEFVQFDQDSDYEVQDLTQGLQVYRKKSELKEQLQQHLTIQQFNQPTIDPNTIVFIQHFLIKQLHIKIYSGSDFQFITLESINESPPCQRHRINDSEILRYLEFRIDMLSIVGKVNTPQQIQALVKVENLEVNYSDKKEIRNGWLGQKTVEQVVFNLLKSLSNLKLLIHTADNHLSLKMNKSPFDLGFTSEILELVNQFKLAKSRLQTSPWKKVYHPENKPSTTKQSIVSNQLENNQSNTKLLLIHIPQNRLSIRLVYKGVTLLSNQTINSAEFLLNQELNDQQKIQKSVNKWVKNLVLDNIGGLIGGTAINVLSDVIVEMLGLGYFIVETVMGK